MDSLKKEKVFFQNLDGWRFFCFFAVYLNHGFTTNEPQVKSHPVYTFFKYTLGSEGALGVNFFFVLSGFLITYLLLKEKETFSKINIGQFYLRRILRIWPLYFLVVFFGFILFPILKDFFNEPYSETANWINYITFTSNFDLIKTEPDAVSLGILWSVAIEEQFYLIWPVLLSVIPRKAYPLLFFSIILLSFGFRFYHAYHLSNPKIIRFHTFSCISDMTVGGMAAYYSFYSQAFKNRLLKLKKFSILLIYIATFVIFFFRGSIFNHTPFLQALDRLVVSVVFCLIILEQNYAGKSLFKMSKFKTVSKWGVITYGLYCLHIIGIIAAFQLTKVLNLTQNVFTVVVVQGLLGLLITLVMAKLSYKYFESPFLKLKDRYSRIRKF